jgi:hypothetical protein
LNRDIKNLLYMNRRVYFDDNHLFNQFIDIALGSGVEGMMTSIPPDDLARFRAWIEQLLPSLDAIINLKSGPLSEHEKATIRAIGEWFDRHPAEDRLYGEETNSSMDGLNAADSLQPVTDSGSPTV